MKENPLSIREQRAANPEAQARKLARSIYPEVLKPFARSFYNKDNLWERRLQTSILNGQPIQMIGFWGVGGKQQPDKHDESLLSEYEAIRGAIKEKYSQIDMMLILANSHGRFNGYQDFDGYLEAIAARANQRGITSVYLDNLYAKWNIPLPDSGLPINKQSQEWIDFNDGLQREEAIQTNHQRGGRRFTQFLESASKHSQAGIAPEEAAFHYWMMRRQERKPLAQSFPNAILLVNGSEDLGRETLPLDMPHMYMRVGPVWFQHD